ncbi:MAG: hypothetical protein ACLPR9_03170 [Acidimicrobiales bacterium]
MTDDLHAVVEGRLRHFGQRCTGERRAIAISQRPGSALHLPRWLVALLRPTAPEVDIP